MNVADYISSGILEAYVLGELSTAQCREVEEMARLHSEVKEEIALIEKSFESLAQATAIQTPPELKSQVLSQIDSEGADIIPMERSRSIDFLRYAAAASLVVALGAVMVAYNYWSKWKSAEEKLSDLIVQNQQFADNYNQVNQRLDNIRASVAIMNSSAYERVVMAATENAPGSQATVYWNLSTQEVYLSIQNLKELSQEQQYQLWAIIDGKPVDAGVFDAGGCDMLLAMKNIGSGAAAFAVTVEPRGGSENPSLETMQVVGEV